MHSSIYFANQNCVLPTGSILFSHHHSHFLDFSNNRENSDSGAVQTINGKNTLLHFHILGMMYSHQSASSWLRLNATVNSKSKSLRGKDFEKHDNVPLYFWLRLGALYVITTKYRKQIVFCEKLIFCIFIDYPPPIKGA